MDDDDDEDEISFLVEETGVPGRNHRPTSSKETLRQYKTVCHLGRPTSGHNGTMCIIPRARTGVQHDQGPVHKQSQVNYNELDLHFKSISSNSIG